MPASRQARHCNSNAGENERQLEAKSIQEVRFTLKLFCKNYKTILGRIVTERDEWRRMIDQDEVVAFLRSALSCESMEYALNDAVAAYSHEGKCFFGSWPDALKEPVADHPVTAMQTDFDVLLG
jgi:hypothetical protein